MITEDGQKVQVLDDENEPSEIRIDESTGKPIPKKKKIKNENGEIEEIKEIIKDKDELSEYDEETGKKIKKYIDNKGKIIKLLEEPSSEEEKKSKKKRKNIKKEKFYKF